MNLTELAEVAGAENFTANIVDGKMIIEPADAGIQIFAALATTEERMETYDTAIAGLREVLVDLQDDNGRLRDLLERTYGVLVEAGHAELADEVIEAAYPVSAIDDEGKEVKFEKEEQR